MSTWAAKRVLVVDDDPYVLQGLTEVEPRGVAIQWMGARDGVEALKLALAETPDVILMDMVMPIMDGRDACRMLKADERTAKIPVIFHSSRSEGHDREAAFSLGADDFLEKPTDPRIIVRRLMRTLFRDES